MITVREVANTVCHKLVADMLYEARIQDTCDYKRCNERVKIDKRDARNIMRTREQFLRLNIQHY